MEENNVIFEPQREAPIRNEEELYSNLIRPQGRTSYEDVFEFDSFEKKIKRKARNLGTPELNLTDLTTAILVGGKSTYQYTWHTIIMINQLVYIQRETGYDLSKVIRFFYDNLTSNLNLSKSSEGALVKAITTKEMKQIQEVHQFQPEQREESDAITEWWKRKTKK